jgi:methylmalonyl-CoA mutase N-terminal domain/subunit
MQRVDAMGGMVAAIEAGFVQQQIEESAFIHQSQIEAGERVIVGVNRFQVEEEVSPPGFRVPPEVAAEQVQRVQEVRARRNGEEAHARLVELERRARGQENLMPALLDAVRAYATLGEICDVLRKVFGVYDEGGQVRRKA